VPGAGGTMASLLGRLSYYAAAAGERRDPIEVSAQPIVKNAALVGAALEKLLGGFPKWVLAGSLKERDFLGLLNNNFLDDVIAYYKHQAAPPIFQARNGSDFQSYLQMRLTDNVNPASFQGGTLAGYVRNFHRFEAATLKALEKNLADTRKKRPLTLILHSAIDHNGAFHRDPYMTAVVTNKKNLTIMIEGGETLAAYQSMIGPLAASHGNNGKIDQVMFAGHGGSRIIELAGTVKENTQEIATYGTIGQDDRPIDLRSDPNGAKAFFDEILDNMDKAVVDPLAPPGPAQQKNRRILFNACLTNSNEVRVALTHDRATAREEIKKYITDNASLATYMATYAKLKGADITSLGANASITQVDLIDQATGKLDMIAPTDPTVTASKLVYMEQGTEPHGVMLAALEAWANEPALAREAFVRRAAKHSTDWDQAIIENSYRLVLKFLNDNRFGTVVQLLADDASALSHMRLADECRVNKIVRVADKWKADIAWQRELLGPLISTTLWGQRKYTALVLQQVHAALGLYSDSAALMVDQVLPNFDVKSALDYVDVNYLVSSGAMQKAFAGTPSKGSLVLALLGVVSPAKPAMCVEHLKKVIEPGAPLVAKLPAVDPVPAVPAGVGPRQEIPAVPEVKGRDKVDEITDKRPAAPKIDDLPELPKMDAVPGPPEPKVEKKPTKSTAKDASKPGASDPAPAEVAPVAPVAPARDARPGRPEAPEIPEVKPYFAPAHGIEALLAGGWTEAAILALVAAP
jgi:hypothetical protein